MCESGGRNGCQVGTFATQLTAQKKTTHARNGCTHAIIPERAGNLRRLKALMETVWFTLHCAARAHALGLMQLSTCAHSLRLTWHTENKP